MEKPQTWYVYTYAKPDGTVFYVGKGTGNRINLHEDEATSGCDCRKCVTIREVWASGNPVQKRIVFETFVEGDALNRETEFIRKYAGEHLTNERKLPDVGNGQVLPDVDNDQVRISRANRIKALRQSREARDVSLGIQYGHILRERILTGVYKTGERLSVTDLYIYERISINAARNAFTCLLKQGLVEFRGNRYYVKPALEASKTIPIAQI